MTCVLAIEAGATRCAAGLYTTDGRLLAETFGGPCNPVAYGLDKTLAEVSALMDYFRKEGIMTTELVVAAGMAGVFSAAWRDKAGQGLCRLPGVVRALVSDDFHPPLAANAPEGPAVLVIAGTGSKVVARDANGREAQAGGRGIPFGEEGSAYQVALSALRACAHAADGVGPATALVQVLPEAAGAPDFTAFTAWANSAGKAELARLARAVILCAEQGDPVAMRCIEEQAARLAAMTGAVHRRLCLPDAAPVFLTGGLFEHSPLYRTLFERQVAAYAPLRVQEPSLRGHCAVFEMFRLKTKPGWIADVSSQPARTSLLPPTEQTRDSAGTIDQMTAREIADAMHAADLEAVRAVGGQTLVIAAAIDAAAQAIRSGGRIIYAGAGTSGRLGVLDASECPPTFGVAPTRVIGLIAGGEQALRHSVEGAEDNADEGRGSLLALAPNTRDIVVGIAASGTTPYVLGALDAARRAGARTVFLCCNPHAAARADMTIKLDTGPEVLAGSTRLKAGTATKLVLNMISTGAMALAGYVYAGRMVHMQPGNAKLRGRAEQMIAALGNVSPARAGALLEEAGNRIAVAILMARTGIDARDAARRLDAAGGNLSDALKG